MRNILHAERIRQPALSRFHECAPADFPTARKTARRSSMTAEEYRCYLIRATGRSRGTL
jgi:hypothetical protein